jgi:uncharacterized protein (TIGR03067 family)
MKAIRITLVIGLAGMAISSSWAADDQPIKQDMTKLEGQWSMVSGSADGQPMPVQTLKQMKRVCKGDVTTTTMGDQIVLKAKITIDPSKKPKTIDYEMTDGFTKGKTQLGIYEVEGDTFKSCFGKPGAERPADFTSKSGDGRTLSVWKREKQEHLIQHQHEWLGIICFSDTVEEPVLWSHYADHHRGMAFEVDQPIEPERLVKMGYSNERPMIDVRLLHNMEEAERHARPVLDRLLRQKSSG